MANNSQLLETRAPFEDFRKDPEEIEVAVDCVCESCSMSKNEGTTVETFDVTRYPVAFPKLSCTNPSKEIGEPSISFSGLTKCFGKDSNSDNLEDPNEPKEIHLHNVDFRSILRIFTYLATDEDEELANIFPELINLCELLLLTDLDKHLDDGNTQLRQDFIRKVCILFVISWHGKINGMKEAERCCRQSRRFLSYLLTFPNLAKEAKHVFFNVEFWPTVGPVQMFEGLCKDFLYCKETLALLCNLTRIDGMAEELEAKSECVSIIKEKFYGYCRKIESNVEELGGLLMHLLVNLSRISGLSEFIITANHAYFIHPVLLNVLTIPETNNAMGKAVWPFLKNLAMTDAGRIALLEQLGVFLGPILYPIAGPEEIDEEDIKKLPSEVQYLPESKSRVKDVSIRECILHILFSLCRYRVGREKLREFNVYQVLKHYHLWEDKKELEEKLESLVNILIRDEETEIPFDDLMDGHSISH